MNFFEFLKFENSGTNKVNSLNTSKTDSNDFDEELELSEENSNLFETVNEDEEYVLDSFVINNSATIAAEDIAVPEDIAAPAAFLVPGEEVNESDFELWEKTESNFAQNNSAKSDEVKIADVSSNAIAGVKSDFEITFNDGSSISVNDYVNNLLSQNIGFETEEEYQAYVLDKFTSCLEEMKATYQLQEDNDGFFSNLYDGAKKLFGLGTSSDNVEEGLNRYEEMVNALTEAVNGTGDMTFEEVYEQYTGTDFSTKKIDKYIKTANMYSAVMVGCQYDEDYLENFEKTTGTSVEDVMQSYAQCQLDTFGDVSDVKNIIDEYSQDQQTYADKLSSIVSTAGIACTVVGAVTSFFCPPVGMALLTAGKNIALAGMFVDNAIDLVDNATDSDGLTKNEIKDFALETGVETVSYAAGRGIGKLTNGLNSLVSSKVAQTGANNVASYIAGQTAETVTDTALSLGADYAIAQGQSLITTGELMDSEDYWSLDRFLGEGKNQLIGILTGLSSEKISSYQQGIIKNAQGMVLAGDTDGAKTYLKEKGMKMNDTSFEGFVKNVQEVEQLKLQNEGNEKQVETAEDVKPVQTPETEMQKTVETEVKNDVDTRADVEKTLDADENVKPGEATETNVKPVEQGENKVPENKTEIKENSVKSGETDNSETITQKIGLQYFAEKTGETAIDYSKLTYDEKVDLLKNAGFDDSDIEYLATELEGTQIANAIKLQLTIDMFGCTSAELKEFAKLEQTQVDDVWSLFLYNVSSNDIAYIITDDNIFKNALKLAEAGVYCDVIKDFATDDNICSKALKLAKAGVYDSSIKDIVSLEETQFENALKFVETGVKGKYIKDLAQFEGTQLDTAIKLAQAGVNGEYIKDIAQFEGTQLDNAIKLVQAGVTGNAIKDLATLEGTQLDNAIKLVKAGVTGNAIKDLAKLEETQIDNAIKLVQAGVTGNAIKDLAKLEGTQLDNAIKLAEAGVNAACITDLAQLEETQLDNAIKLAKAGVNGFDIKDLVTDDKACNNAIILKAAGIGKSYIKDLATDDRICNNAIKLAEAGFWDIYIKDLATLEETQIDNAIKLKNAGFDGSYIKDLATLKGTQIDNAIKLKEARILAIYIKDLVTDDNKCNNMLKYINMGIEGDKALELINNGIDLLSKLDLVDVSKENQTDMFKNFFANNSNVDEIIKNTDFAQYGKDGIPLEYSRTEFLGDLSSELSKLPTESQNEIIKKLGIDVIQDATGNITGYDGIIDLTKLSSDGTEGKVLELANNFILNNKVVTGDSESDNALNSLISGMPEFINTIGKQQHDTHSYSLDTHILETYKAAISDSGYDDLSNYQKLELKLMTILHDISKGENTADDNHPLVSAKYAKDILSRYSLSESTQYDIVNNILNHHWGKDYNTQSVSTEETAVKMGTVSNYNLQKIFAKADLTGMGNSEFSNGKLEGLSDDNQGNLVNTINKTKETTPLVYTTPIIKPDLIPNQEITLSDGTTKTIKSFNLAELPDDYDMEEFGFLPGTKAKDVTLGVHTANSQSQFNIFEMLTSDPITSSPQSVSIVSKDNNALFKRFGVAIDLKGSDVINATHYDQGCGTAKTGNQLIKLATGNGIYESWREILPGKVQEKLDITSSEYSQLASIMEDYKYLTQIKDSQEITIGEKTFTGSEIKTAISTAQSELMQMTNGTKANDGQHSYGDITELVVKRAEVVDNTYVLRYDSADDINNENIPTDEREALNAFLSEIPENSTIIFAGYDGYLYSGKANQWKVNKNAIKNADTGRNQKK